MNENGNNLKDRENESRDAADEKRLAVAIAQQAACRQAYDAMYARPTYHGPEPTAPWIKRWGDQSNG